MGLLALPTEIIEIICSHVYPGSLVDWACTCRHLFQVSQDALKRHALLRRRYHRIHDRQPGDVLEMVKLFLCNPDYAWYVRGMEVWDSRATYADWDSSHVQYGLPDGFIDSYAFLEWPERQVDCRKFGTDGGLHNYSDWELHAMRAVLSYRLCLPESEIDLWMTRIGEGSDDHLKMIILALSTEIQTIHFVHYAVDPSADRSMDSTLKLLNISIKQILASGHEWQCFRQLRTVHAGTHSDNRHLHDSWIRGAEEMGPLLLLPAIETLTLECCGDWEVDGGYQYEGPSGGSNCSALKIVNFNMSWKALFSMVDACRSLKKLRLEFDYLFNREILQLLVRRFGDTLEDLQVRWHLAREVRWTRDLQNFVLAGRGFVNLVNLDLGVNDLVDWEGTDVEVFASGRQYADIPASGDFGKVMWLSIPSILGKSLHTIQKFTVNNSFRHSLSEPEVRGFMQMLMQFVDIRPERLKVICLHHEYSPRVRRSGLEFTESEFDEHCVGLREHCIENGYFLHSLNHQWKDCARCAAQVPEEDELFPLAAIPDEDQWGGFRSKDDIWGGFRSEEE